jgi:hypothetical protein
MQKARCHARHAISDLLEKAGQQSFPGIFDNLSGTRLSATGREAMWEKK